MSKPRVLVVEDEPLIAKNIRRRLQGLGYEVPIIASSGAEAVQAAVETRPDVVLMDIHLEGEMDGVEAAAQIRARRDIPVIYLTAHADEAILERAKVTEPFGYILKPFQDRELHSNIAMALYKHEQERKLRESEQKFRNIVEHSSDGIVLTDEQGIIIEWNRGEEQITGLKRDQVLGRPIWDARFQAIAEERKVPEVYEQLKAKTLEFIKTGRASWLNQSLDWEIQRPDGTRRITQALIFPIETERGFMACNISRDITERKRAELKAQEWQERHELVAAATGQIVYDCNTGQDTVQWSGSVENVLGYSLPEMSGGLRQWRDLLHPDDRREAIRLLKTAVSQQTPYDFEYRFQHKQGHYIFVHDRGYPFLPPGDPSLHYIGIMEDITARKRAEEALRESEARMKSIFRAAPIGIGVVSNRVLLDVNERFCEITGYSRDELIGKNARVVYPTDEDYEYVGRDKYKQIQKQGTGTVETRFRRKDGKIIDVLLSSTPLDPTDLSAGVTFTVLDITERKRSEELIRTQRDLALALSAAPELEEGLRLCLEAALQVSGMDCGGIYLVDEASGALDMVFHKGLPPDFVRSVSHYDTDSANVQLIMVGKPVYTRNLGLEVPLDEAERHEGLRAIAVIPIHHEGRVIGCLNIASHTLDEVPAFACDTLETIVAQIGNSIARLRVEEVIKRRNKELAALNAITAAVSQSLDLKEILDAALAETTKMLNVEGGLMYLLDPTSQVFAPAAHRGVSQDILREVTGFKMGQGLSGRVAESGEPLIVADLSADSRNISTAASREGWRSYAGVPIRSKGEVVGMMALVTRQEGRFKPRHVGLLSYIGNQIGVAIENARLFRETKRRFEETMALHQTSLDITAQLAMTELLKSIVKRAVTLLRAKAGDIYLYDPEREELRGIVGHGYAEKYIGIAFRSGEGMAGRVFQTGEPFIVDDYRTWEGRATVFEADQPFTAMLGVPLKWQERVIGALCIDADMQERTFNQDDVWLATLFANQAAIAIENARLYQDEQRRAAQLAIVNQVARRVALILDPAQLLQEVVTAIQQSFNYYHVGLFLLDEVADELKMQAMAGGFVGVASPDHRLALGEGMAGWTAETGQSLLANDVSQEPHYVLGILKEALTKAELCVPLKLAGKVIGVLDIQSTQLSAFDQADLMAMETLADQLAVAIENARLYQETARRLEETEALSAVTTALTYSLDLDQVLQSIVESATRLIPASASGVIHLTDPTFGKLMPRAASPQVQVHERLEMPIGTGIAGLVMQEKRLINIPNVEGDHRFLRAGDAAPYKSLLTAPMIIDGDCIGTLSLNSDQASAFSGDDEWLLATLAAQAAVAVRNARLHQEVQRRVEELTFLNQIGRAVTSILDLERVLTTALEETTLVLKTEACSVLMLEEESDELVFKAVAGSHSEKMKGFRFSLGQGIAGWVVRQGQPLLVHDVRKDPRFYPGIDETTGFVTKSILAVPLKVKGIVVGVIEAVNKTEGDFSQADVELMSSMAQWAAIAVENAQLFTEMQRHFEEMTALYNVSLDIIARLEKQELLKSIVERAVGLLKADTGGIYLYNPERGELKLVIGYDYTEKYVGTALKPGEGMAGKVFQSGEPMIVDDYRAWQGRASAYEADQPFSAALEVPLKWEEQVIGVLSINADAQKRTFNQEDIRLATLFANQAAIAIENARLYEELQNRMEELKRTQAQLIQSAKLAAIGELAAGVAHEINNPLTSIIGFTHLLLREVDDNNPMKEDLKIIDREAARTKAIVGGLLDFSRQTEPRLESANVNKVLQDTVVLARHQAKVSRVIIQESYDETLPLVWLDINQMKQVFLNMMTNAIQAMPEGGELKVMTAYRPQTRRKSVEGPALSKDLGELSRAVEGGVEEVDGVDCVAVEFHDTGIGIPLENLPRIFDPFFTTKVVGQGTGLGLSISYGIVEGHGGWIEVESQVGKGSTFMVMLPVAGRMGH